MTQLTTEERFKRIYAREDVDRIPIYDVPWEATVERWQREGMPENISMEEYFDIDKTAYIQADNSPRYPYRVIEETDEYIVYTSKWGVTEKQFKHSASTPDFLEQTIIDRETWEAAKKRMTLDDDRIDWAMLKKNYPIWRKEGRWIVGGLWFGFDVTHSWMMGTDRFLLLMAMEPELCTDIFETQLTTSLALMDRIWEAGYHFHEVHWYEDMGYKNTQFFSVDMYKELVLPFQKRAIDWGHAKGCKVRLHSCGDINPFVPILLGNGLDGLNPIEVKAGMDPAGLKKQYGDRLLFHGGFDALLYEEPGAMVGEIERLLPTLMKDGGYIFSSDHSIPSSVSLEEMRAVIETVKRVGAY